MTPSVSPIAEIDMKMTEDGMKGGIKGNARSRRKNWQFCVEPAPDDEGGEKEAIRV